MTESALQFQAMQVRRVLAEGGWQEDRHATLLAGEMFHFQVDSSHEPGLVYTVRLDEDMDVTGTEFNGACDCEDYTIRCRTNFLGNGRNIVDYVNGDHESRTRCKHINLAIREFTRRVVCRLATNQA